MNIRSTWCLSVLSLLVLIQTSTAQEREVTRKVTFEVKPGQRLEDLVETGRWEILEVRGTTVTALEQQGGNARRVPAIALEARVLEQGFNVLEADIDRELDAFRAMGSEGQYHSIDEGATELEAYATNYPEICHRESLGKTHEGRDIWAVRIGKNPDNKDLPRMLIFGLVHAREWISAELPFYTIKQLLEGYGTNPELTELVDTRVIWVIPITNPDGLEYSQKQSRMWRKNRNPNGSWSTGVDVNRNFEVGWGTGSSSWGSSDVYRGPHHGSENETKALLQLMERERFHVSLCFHSYSEIILHPWGQSEDDPPHLDVYKHHSEKMKAFNGYRHGPVAQVLYLAGGATDDTFFAKYGCWSWTFELGRQFVPPENQIQSICESNFGAVLHLIKSAQELKDNRPSVGVDADAAAKVAFLEEQLVMPARGEGPRAIDAYLPLVTEEARVSAELREKLMSSPQELLRRIGQAVLFPTSHGD